MPVRDKFPEEYFSTNPLKGESPHGAYRRLQWGNEPVATWEIEAPEPMAVLGRLAKVYFLGRKVQSFHDWEFFVAVGTKRNFVYFVPMDDRRRPIDFPENYFRHIEHYTTIKRTDYYSEKGGEPGYYFHDHEKPYPTLWGCDDHFVILPANHNGRRSYAVNDEGIIG